MAETNEEIENPGVQISPEDLGQVVGQQAMQIANLQAANAALVRERAALQAELAEVKKNRQARRSAAKKTAAKKQGAKK